MAGDLGPLIEAARDLAWRPTSNTAHRESYRARIESHQALCAVLASTSPVAEAGTPLAFLLAAIRRAAAASYSNRWGPAYYERREAIFQLRGALVVWLRTELEAA